MRDIRDIKPGSSWACEYTRTLVLDETGAPASPIADTQHTIIRTGTAIILKRDVEQELVLLQDVKTQEQFVVDFASTRNCDEIEWINNEPTS